MMRRLRERRQAGLLDRYWARLVNRRSNDAQGPADGIDPAVAAVADRLAAERPRLDPTTTTIDRLWNRLEASTAVRADNPRAWSGPTIGQNSNHSARRRAVRETEEQSLSSASTDQPASLEERRWATELWKIAAAILAFAIVGGLLVLVLRDTGDKQPQIIAPGPTSTSVSSPVSNATSTTLSSPTSNGTPTIDSTRAAAIAHLTATAEIHAGDATATVSTFATVQAGLPSPGEVVATIAVDGNPIGLASAAGALWVANAAGSVARIDPATNAVVATIVVPNPTGRDPMPFYIASYEGQVWISGQAAGEPLYRIDPATNQIAQSIPLVASDGSDGFGVTSLFVDDTGIWVSDFDGGRLVHIDPASGSVLATIDVPGARGIASGFGSLWVISNDMSRLCVMRIDPASNSVVSIIDTGRSAEFIATGAGAVWEADDDASGIVTRIDPTTSAVAATIDTGLREARFVLVAGGRLWVNGWLGSGFDNGLLTIDPATNALSRFIDNAPSISWWLADFDGSIWATHGDINEVVRIDPAP